MYDESIVSDLHKDARGFRPGDLFWHNWKLASDEQRQRIWDSLVEESQVAIEREREMESLAAGLFEIEVEDTMAALGITMREAIDRLMREDEVHDLDYFLYHRGLSIDESAKYEKIYNEG